MLPLPELFTELEEAKLVDLEDPESTDGVGDRALLSILANKSPASIQVILFILADCLMA